MRGLRFAHVCVVAGAVLMAPAPLWAQTQDAQALRQEIEQLRKELDTLQQQYGDRLNALEAKLNATEPTAQQPAPGAALQAPQQPGAATAQVPPGAEGAGGPSGALPVYGGSAGSKVFNPDIAVIGDFLGAAGSNSVNPAPALAMHESEASFQAIVDPYARADFFLSFGEEASSWRKASSRFLPSQAVFSCASGRCEPRSARSTRCTTTCFRGPIARS